MNIFRILCSSMITDAVIRRSLLIQEPTVVLVLFGARLRDVFAVRFPRSSHLPAAFCAVPRTVTCSLQCLNLYLRLLDVNDTIFASWKQYLANISHYKVEASKCQVPANDFCVSTHAAVPL